MDHRKRITGVVVSAKTPKTITVMVEGYRKHPKYKKEFNSDINTMLMMN